MCPGFDDGQDPDDVIREDLGEVWKLCWLGLYFYEKLEVLT